MIKNDEIKIQKIKIKQKRLSKPIQEIQRKVDLRKLTKTKTKYKGSIAFINITKKDLFNFFSKAPSLRTKQEVEIFANYLSENYQYFTKLKNEDSQMKVEKLTKICRLEKDFKGESIINFGEEGDKFYIVLEGTVEIFKPKYEEVSMLPSEFIDLLNKIKEMDGNLLRYDRIKEKNIIFFETYLEQNKQNENTDRKDKNNNLNFNNQKISNSNHKIENLENKQIFIMESEEKLGEYGAGFSFGEIALIKKTKRNATIKAKNNCFLLTIEKKDYNRAILEYEKKKLGKSIDDFILIYSFFKDFSHDRIIRLFNCFSKKTIYRDEYLYQQNKEDNCLYIINNGTFLVSCHFSFFWLNDYLEYIIYEQKNVLEYLINNKELKYSDLVNEMKKCYKKLGNNKLPTNYINYDLWEEINEKIKKDDLYQLKRDEEKLNDPDKIYNINIKKINYNEILGIEEIFDFKKRFCACKCLSEKADIKYINIYEFMKLIMNFGEDELKYLLKVVNERKKLLINQIIKAIKNEERKIISNFDHRYENLLKEADYKNTTKEKKKNQIFSTIKLKGYKDNLHDILDNKIPLMETESSCKNNENKEKNEKLRKNKSSEDLMNNFYSKENKKGNNTVRMKIIKIMNDINNKRKINYQNIENIQLNQKSGQQNSASTSKYPFNRNNYLSNSNSCVNFSNTKETFFHKFKKRKISNYSMDKKIKTTKSSFEINNSKINLDDSKTITNSPNIQNIKANNNLIKFKSDIDENKITQFSNHQVKEVYGNIILPNLFKDKNFGISKNNPKFNSKRKINNYNNFYLIYNFDKHFFASTEFRKQLNSLKNELLFENDKAIK